MKPKPADPSPASLAVIAAQRSRWSVRPLTLTSLPPRWRQVHPNELHASGARAFVQKAQVAGLTVAARKAGDAEQVGVRRRKRNRLWMRATWIAGRTTGVVVGGKLLNVTDATKLLYKAIEPSGR